MFSSIISIFSTNTKSMSCCFFHKKPKQVVCGVDGDPDDATEASIKRYFISNASPSDRDIERARESWGKILSETEAPGFLRAKAENKIDESVTPIVFFYNTFFEVWRTKYSDVLDEIYKNNIKIKSGSMVAMIAFILNCKKHSDQRFSDIIESHGKMRVEDKHYFFIGEVFTETIIISLDEMRDNSEIIVCWRKIISYVIEKILTLMKKRVRTPTLSSRKGI